MEYIEETIIVRKDECCKVIETANAISLVVTLHGSCGGFLDFTTNDRIINISDDIPKWIQCCPGKGGLSGNAGKKCYIKSVYGPHHRPIAKLSWVEGGTGSVISPNAGEDGYIKIYLKIIKNE